MENKKPKAILTIDLEFWYNARSIELSLLKEKIKLEDYLLKSTLPILEILKINNIKATFFVLGSLAEIYPELIKKIADAGHEIASHGYSHRNLLDLTKEDFEKEVSLSKKILENITGKKLLGIRIPSCSLNEKNQWAMEIINKYGFKYDSSIFPMRTPLYGIKNAPLKPYRISFSNILKTDRNSPIIELPIAVYQFKNSKIRIPVGGGFYFRAIPFFIYIRLLRSAASMMTPVTYFHPYDLCSYVPKTTSVSWFKKKLKFYGVKRGRKKFEKLIKKFNFIPIEQYLKENRLI